MISGVRASSIRIEFDLVDDRVIERPLHHLLEPELHVVAEIVEAELVVRAVGHVGRVLVMALNVVDPMDDAADGEAEETIDLAHPFTVALGEVVVHGDDMDALARKRVEIDGKGRDQRLAFAGLHLGDHAAMKDDAANQLDVVMALTERALGRLANRGESLDQDIVKFLALSQPVLELLGAGAQRRVVERGQFRLERVDVIDQGARDS